MASHQSFVSGEIRQHPRSMSQQYDHYIRTGCLLAILIILSLIWCRGQGSREARIDLYLEAAQRAQSSGDLKLAAENYRKVLALKPDFPEVQTNLGLLLYLGGGHREAIDLFKSVLRIEPDLLVANLFLGKALIKVYEYDQAIGPLRKVLKKDSSNVDARLALCEAYSGTKTLELAVQECWAATRISVQNPEAWYAFGNSVLRAAKNLVDDWASKGSKSAYFYILKAESYRERDNYAQAVLEYQKALGATASVPAGTYPALGEAHLLQGNAEEAKKQFNRMPRDSETVNYAWGMAQVALAERNYLEFESQLRQIEQINVDFVSDPPWFVVLSLPQPALISVGEDFQSGAAKVRDTTRSFIEIMLRRANQRVTGFEPPVAVYRKPAVLPIEGSPQSPDQAPGQLARAFKFSGCVSALRSLPDGSRSEPHVLAQLAECEWALGDFKRSLQASSEALRENPQNEVARYWKIKSLLQLSKYAFARLSLLPDGAGRLHELLGKSYEARQQDDKAAEEYQRAIQSSPGNVEAYILLAGAQMRNARYEEAVESFKQALQHSPNDPDAHYGLGVAYVQLRQAEVAVQHLRKALQVLPDWSEAHTSLGQAFRQLGHNREAIGEFEKAANSDTDGSLHYQLFQLYKKIGEEEKAKQALEKSVQLRDRAARQRLDLTKSP